MTQYKLSINNKTYEVEAPENMPLLWVIRDLVGLTGTKFGCGKGLCGACTIHLNGSAVRSCSMPVSAGQGAQITTIEGLSNEGDHPLQTAWQELSVPQCGYCQPGQLMNAAALLKSNAKPNPKDIDQAMSGNICRCGTYQRIKAGILRASGQDAEEAKS
jgi:isoquinoline 1-oxidoreductase alpha subunit